jgi:hypothetical protein
VIGLPDVVRFGLAAVNELVAIAISAPADRAQASPTRRRGLERCRRQCCSSAPASPPVPPRRAPAGGRTPPTGADTDAAPPAPRRAPRARSGAAGRHDHRARDGRVPSGHRRGSAPANAAPCAAVPPPPWRRSSAAPNPPRAVAARASAAWPARAGRRPARPMTRSGRRRGRVGLVSALGALERPVHGRARDAEQLGQLTARVLPSPVQLDQVGLLTCRELGLLAAQVALGPRNPSCPRGCACGSGRPRTPRPSPAR